MTENINLLQSVIKLSSNQIDELHLIFENIESNIDLDVCKYNFSFDICHMIYNISKLPKKQVIKILPVLCKLIRHPYAARYELESLCELETQKKGISLFIIIIPFLSFKNQLDKTGQSCVFAWQFIMNILHHSFISELFIHYAKPLLKIWNSAHKKCKLLSDNKILSEKIPKLLHHL